MKPMLLMMAGLVAAQVPAKFAWQDLEQAKKAGAEARDGFVCTLDVLEWDWREAPEKFTGGTLRSNTVELRIAPRLRPE